MSREEAMRCFARVVGDLPFTAEELIADPRAAHILVHGCGLFPPEVDEDNAFTEVLGILTGK